uniref:HD-GYP domain-containing protein n=1 Tax=Agathobacter sp. TaxID=2021311 RepID=UPI00405680CE
MLRVLIVDDIETNRFVLKKIIEDMGYQPVLAESGSQALRIMERILPDLILLDVSMPEMDGYELCGILKQNIDTRDIPVLFISAYDDPQDVLKGFEAGGADYVSKPLIPEVVKARVGAYLKLSENSRSILESNRRLQVTVVEQLRQIEEEKKKVLYALLMVARKNASYDEDHMERLQYNCKILAQAMQLSPEFEHLVSDTFVETIEMAAPLCDLGNVGISLEILQKKSRLTEEEAEIMQKHTIIGSQILEDIRTDNDYNDFLTMSQEIALYHHENWNGSGYPYGRKEKEIPLAAQIVALVSNYCALTEKRSFRDAFNREEALQIIEADAGVKFNAKIVDICKMIARQLR